LELSKDNLLFDQLKLMSSLAFTFLCLMLALSIL
jgi:hypothetical protein